MAAMPNNEHLPIFRTWPGGHGSSDWGVSCSCGYFDPHLFSTQKSAAFGWLDHALDASVQTAALTNVIGPRLYTVGTAWE